MDVVRGSNGLAACRLTCTVGSVVGACAGCGLCGLCMVLVGSGAFIARDGWLLEWCMGLVWVYIKNFASATFVVEAI